MTSSSVIFRPYRALGLISSDIPFVVKYKPHSKEYNVLVPVGERFNVYQLPNLRFVGISKFPFSLPFFEGDCLPADITSFTSDRSYVYASSGNVIYAFRGLRHIFFKLEGHTAPIRRILAFWDSYLASYDESGLFIVWNLKTRESVTQTSFPENAFEISSMCHPTGYGDKLLLGSSQGPLHLWKTLAKKPIYWFRGFDSSVTCLVQAPSFDVCAIGLGNGQIVLHNLRYDMTLITVGQDGGAITTIEFRSGKIFPRNSAGLGASEALRCAGIENLIEPNASIYLLAGSESGQLSMWELESGGTCRAVNQADEFHLARVIHLFCIPSGEAAGSLVSSGADNCVKVSFFDRPDSLPCTKHIRSGHFLPPNKIVFWTGGSAGGSLLVSGGPDSQLRIFSTYNERYDRSLGRAYSPSMPSAKRLTSVAQRLPYLLPGPSAIALSPGRANDWDSIAVAHTDRRQVSTWNFVKATRGRHWLDPKRFHGKGGEALRVHRYTTATCLCMTRCGHFVVIGYSSGDVVKFNIQSGLEYGEFGNDGKAHESGVIGVHVTNVNRVLITVGSAEVKFWYFSTGKLIDSLPLTSPPRFAKFHDESDALALALSTGEVVLINAVNRQIFRRFPNSVTHPCNDLALSSDGTMMVTTHRGDPLIKTWDVVDCKLVDCFRVRRPATSVAFSPADDLLATTHTACLGIYLWDNRATYQRLHLKPLPEDYTPPDTADFTELPTEGLSAKRDFVEGEEGDVEKMDVDEEKNEKDTCPPMYLSLDQLQDKMATLSGLPPSFFAAFLQLDAIKKRNAEAMKVTDEMGPPQLPFFLPAIETTTGMVWLDDEEEEKLVSEEPKKVVEADAGSRKHKKRRREMAVEELVLNLGSGVLNSLLGDGSLKDPLNNETLMEDCDASSALDDDASRKSSRTQLAAIKLLWTAEVAEHFLRHKRQIRLDLTLGRGRVHHDDVTEFGHVPQLCYQFGSLDTSPDDIVGPSDLIYRAKKADKSDEVMSRLRRLTPSALDAEVRLLAPSREELMEAFAAIDRGDGEHFPLSANPYARLSAFLRLLLNRYPPLCVLCGRIHYSQVFDIPKRLINQLASAHASSSSFRRSGFISERIDMVFCELKADIDSDLQADKGGDGGIGRFRRNLDFDLATACLESLLRYHGDLIARPPKAPATITTKHFNLDLDDDGDGGSFGLGDMVAAETGCYNDHLDADRPLELMEAVLEAKRVSHAVLDEQISRSIALVDFVRNATSTLQM
ncbi:WD repeat-containing protein [Echinococcus granulosus]|uniref:WD repeat-containing protein n=1 Tax=Echinococcus granulosus TaxID=6210 RepID=W6V0Y1_ECHGR|nr:WD repeat-containing protein [Echinococcus granulosus]EUB59454.1 WD repeat-containing protein [Echinococcus granulosus]